MVVTRATQREREVVLGERDRAPIVERAQDLECLAVAVVRFVVEAVAAIQNVRKRTERPASSGNAHADTSACGGR
jgi:hypothetical protein